MSRAIRTLGIVGLAAAGSLAACEQQPPETQYVEEGAPDDAPTAAPSAAESAPSRDEAAARASAQDGAEAPRTIAVAGVLLTPPVGWEPVEPESRMRKAQFAAPAAEGDQAAQVVVFHFGAGQGGSVEANLARWARQVLDESGEPVIPEITQEEGEILRTTVAVYQGEYQSGMPGQPREPRPGWMLLGGIVEGGPEGPLFVRMTGPASAVEPQLDRFETFIRSARPAP